MDLQPFAPSSFSSASSEAPLNSWQIVDPFRDEQSVFRLDPFKRQFRNEITKPLAPLMSADLIESENDYHVHVDLPGVEDLDISIKDRVLCMKAERKAAHEVETDVVHSFERSYGKVQRQIHLPANADVDRAQAKFRNGVLTVSFPKLPTSAGAMKLTIL